MHKNNLPLKKILYFCLLFFYSCSPKIEFTALPKSISKGDSVLLNWKIKGKPTLLFDQRKIAYPPNDSLEILEFTLSVQKNKKVKFIKRQVSVLPKESNDRVILMTTELKGDTLIAAGIKDSVLWKNYEIISLATVTSRSIMVTHANITAAITRAETASFIWKGKEYAGYWKFMSLLTVSEKQNHSMIPSFLEVRAIIQHTKNEK